MHHHLDDDAVDASCLDGCDLRARAEYVALDTGEWIYIVAKALAQQTIEKCSLRDAKEIATFPGEAGAHDLRASVSRSQDPWRARRLRHDGYRARARCTPLLRTAPTTSTLA